jgi:hypothetical protein
MPNPNFYLFTIQTFLLLSFYEQKTVLFSLGQGKYCSESVRRCLLKFGRNRYEPVWCTSYKLPTSLILFSIPTNCSWDMRFLRSRDGLRPGFDSRQCQIFLFSTASTPALGPTPGLRCRDIRTKFHKDWFRHSKVNRGIHRHTQPTLFFQNKE